MGESLKVFTLDQPDELRNRRAPSLYLVALKATPANQNQRLQ